MRCPNCGNEVAEGLPFCVICGTMLVTGEEKEPDVTEDPTAPVEPNVQQSPPQQNNSFGGQPIGNQGTYGNQQPSGNQQPYVNQQTYGNQQQFVNQQPYGNQGPYGNQVPYGNQQPYGMQGNMPPKKSKGGMIALIIIGSVIALALIGVLVFFLVTGFNKEDDGAKTNTTANNTTVNTTNQTTSNSTGNTTTQPQNNSQTSGSNNSAGAQGPLNYFDLVGTWRITSATTNGREDTSGNLGTITFRQDSGVEYYDPRSNYSTVGICEFYDNKASIRFDDGMKLDGIYDGSKITLQGTDGTIPVKYILEK